MDAPLSVGIKPKKEIKVSQPSDGEPENVQIDSLFAVEGLIKNHLQQIEDLATETRRLKEMFDDYLVNDEQYSAADEAAKQANKEKNSAKKEALSKPEAEAIISKVKDAREQLKDYRESLSNHLREYERLSGSNQIEIEAGDIRQIVYKAKLVKASTSR
ncbi:hypothetical protein ACFL1M_00870 [Patescibacteria group bacterium]